MCPTDYCVKFDLLQTVPLNVPLYQERIGLFVILSLGMLTAVDFLDIHNNLSLPGEVIAGGLVQDVKVLNGPPGSQPIEEGSHDDEGGHSLKAILLYTGCAMAALIAIMMKLVYFDLGVSLTQPKLPPSPLEAEGQDAHSGHNKPRILLVKAKRRRVKLDSKSPPAVGPEQSTISDGSESEDPNSSPTDLLLTATSDSQLNQQTRLTPQDRDSDESEDGSRMVKPGVPPGRSLWETHAPKEFRIDPKRHFKHPLQISWNRGKAYDFSHSVLNMCIVVAGRIMEITLEEGHMNNTCRWALAISMSTYLLLCTLFLGMARGGPQGARRCSKQVRISIRILFALLILATGLLIEDAMSVVGLLTIHCGLLLVLVTQELYSRTFQLYRGPFNDKEVAAATSLPLLPVQHDS